MTPAKPDETGGAVLPDDNDGIEQDAFEEWAKCEGFDMERHPLHWLFLNARTSSARRGWRAALRHANARIRSALTPAKQEGA